MFLDVASRLPADEILKKLPSMHHQFLELAGVDITKEPMEIGPTCHYVMGGVEVDPDTAASSVPGLFAAGEVSGGMHGSNRLGGNSLSDLLVFGKRAGDGAADYLESLGSAKPAVVQADLDAAVAEALAPFERAEGENPYTVHHELQQTMQDLVGLIRRESEVKDALAALEKFRERAADASPCPVSGPTTRAGTTRRTCGTCCSSPSAWRWPPWSGRSPAAGTPARTTRRCRRSGAR